MRYCLLVSLIVFLFAPFQAVRAVDRPSISGLVADPDAHPIGGASVVLRRQSGSEGKGKEYKTKTDSKGSFNFGNVDPGTYEMTCEKEGYRPDKRFLSATGPEPRTVSMTLVPDVISGQALHLEKVDPKTARVFITNASLELKTPKDPSLPAGGASSDLPYSTLPEMAALLYGGENTGELMGGNLDPSAGSSAVLSSLHQNNISLLDVQSHQIVAVLPTQASPIWIGFSRDGSRFWIIDSMRNLSMYSGSGDVKNSVNVGEHLVTDFVVGESKLYMAARSWPTPLVLFVDAISNALIGNFSLPTGRGQPGGIALSGDGRTILVTMGTTSKGWLEVMDAGSGQVMKEIEVGAQPMGVGITPDGSRAIVANYSAASIDVVDLAQQKVVSHIPTGILPARVCVRPDGRAVFVTNNGDNSLTVIDPLTGLFLNKVPVGKGPLGLAVTPDGSKVYVANRDSANVTTVDGLTFAVLSTTPQTSGSQVFGVAVRP